ncbi:hypothetical protein P153DRAFT_370552 [Dothidotthia symphoricarpi CBS 119687]|uniref:Zn(2)-C6 fungal-type domain-containing protein n=1 Tax=Dothidotthia symphoricarpi CBS 119687 TaxID=1392245 RepID=A0A6A5ZXY0_9PLEO|nr:uncharacterized protein P153DRAFT_370552 [Dothidotthia symphoricarpi CBS 119687]KAF2124622.1 hypothetical protein P153DRAFT_370552 [Dothidotthia symphoricarpi CBS 119687]
MNHGALSTTPNAAAPQLKPIRFVTNNDGPYAKRRRINTACLTCRRKKTRCSGDRPSCARCLQNNLVCAGYGDDNTSSEAKADAKGSNSNVVSNAPSREMHQPIDPQLSRPQEAHTVPIASRNAGPTVSSRFPKREANDGMLSLSTRNRMPYFRYFGPTAIMPGFKQMVVKVRGNRHGSGQKSSDQNSVDFSPAQPPLVGSPQSHETHAPLDIPVYDNSAMLPSPLITQLCKLFFTHLGCCFPFLQRERFMRDLEEKQVDAILVDAVCALAARFSTKPVSSHQQKVGDDEQSKVQPSEYGQAFAHRAKSAIPDTFPCPSVAVVQAALLLAYDEFGASRDSGLWMYLGIAIRMAQDLGMHTLEGLKYEGHHGPTPKSVMLGPGDCNETSGPAEFQEHHVESVTPEEREQRDVERERLDTFWSIFFLDRVISSGTGRPVTLRDQEIEISFPSLDAYDAGCRWPLPFPALIRIIHLYGRVTDLLNGIRNATDITEGLQTQLNALENRLTDIYQNLSPRLHFNAVNFQQYVKINQGTNFLLLHCWFHTLIVLLHQPTILKTFEDTPQSLSANSRELSMSSAKTVADILAFTELIDAKTGVGNPFTSQPIYIAACAFLKETAIHSASSQPQTRPPSPGVKNEHGRQHTGNDLAEGPNTYDKIAEPPDGDRCNLQQDREQKQAAKHTLLASAANQNYQRCYRALHSLETYWAGVKYILTVLDQKAKGVGDPLLYTREEMESALEMPRPEPSFTSPGWRRKLSWGTYLTAQNPDGDTARMPAVIRKGARTPILPGSPMAHPSQGTPHPRPTSHAQN